MKTFDLLKHFSLHQAFSIHTGYQNSKFLFPALSLNLNEYGAETDLALLQYPRWSAL